MKATMAKMPTTAKKKAADTLKKAKAAQKVKSPKAKAEKKAKAARHEKIPQGLEEIRCTTNILVDEVEEIEIEEFIMSLLK
jgi:hypothetical protein